MQRSSQTIGTIAAALAKAQAQLVNPEKSLTGTIRSDVLGATERSFRYAPLSSGLDIVRKTLSQHEIATVQTTSIDDTAGIVRLSTVLAHASGEWIASDWPVCAISDSAAPHRMGAALTYARRYALFTLVGIAGEDDLDAPDLVGPTPATSLPKRPKPNSKTDGNGGNHRPSAGAANRGCQSELSAALSASLRDELLREIESLNTADDAAVWAHRRLGAKSTLRSADAAHVERGFQSRLMSCTTDAAARSIQKVEQTLRRSGQGKKRSRSATIDKTVLALPAPRRIRDRDHVKSVAKQPCLVCGRRPTRHSGARLATSSLYRFAEDIIVKSIAAEMKRPGGRGPVSIRAQRPASFGLKYIRCQAQLVRPGQNCETKPI